MGDPAIPKMVTFANYLVYKLLSKHEEDIPIGTRALILSKYYYGALSRKLDETGIERYFSILYFLSAHNNCSQQRICNSLAIDKSAMVKVMDYLIQKGAVERSVNPDDRREHYVTLTKKGKRQTAEVVRAFNRLDKQMFTGLSEKDRRDFRKLMLAVTWNLKSLPGDDLFFNYRMTRKPKSKKTKDGE